MTIFPIVRRLLRHTLGICLLAGLFLGDMLIRWCFGLPSRDAWTCRRTSCCLYGHDAADFFECVMFAVLITFLDMPRFDRPPYAPADDELPTPPTPPRPRKRKQPPRGLLPFSP